MSPEVLFVGLFHLSKLQIFEIYLPRLRCDVPFKRGKCVQLHYPTNRNDQLRLEVFFMPGSNNKNVALIYPVVAPFDV